ncbi:MAG: PD-(D/E)XK nuclease family protein [Bacteroidales bacterium]|nr:PD-(D/E)XK nuclease family protein [Bacteroidales bacterium]
MGMLETRLLHFKNVYIISLNEGIFPKGKPAPSFIPYSLRNGYELPTIKHQDSIFSYYFHRLIAGAENITLLYSKQLSDKSKGEKSRFISQLEYSPKYTNKNISLQFKLFSRNSEPISIIKDDALLEKIKKIFNCKILSPSAISNFNECSLRFYFKYIAQLDEPKQLTEIPSEGEFGSIFHEAICSIYKPYTNKIIDKNLLQEILKKEDTIDQCIYEAMAKVLSLEINKSNISGYNVLIFRTIKKYITNTIQKDALDDNFTIISLEEKTSVELTLNENISITIGGYLDRVDLINNKIRIIDYKTGKPKNQITLIEDLFYSNKKENFSHVLQLLTYCYLKDKTANKTDVLPELRYIKQFNTKSNDCIFLDHVPLNSYYTSVKPVFEKMLIELISDIFNKEIKFCQTEHTQRCEYCSFAIFCR